MRKLNRVFLLVLLACALCVCCIACGEKEKVELGAVDVDSIQFDGDTIQWQEVEHADGYEIAVGEAEPVPVEKGSYAYPATASFTVRIRATASADNSTYASASTYVEKGFTALDKPVVTFTNGFFTWNAVQDATSYTYEQNGADYRGYTSELKAIPLKSESSDKATLRVRGMTTKKDTFGVWSDSKQITLLSEPKNITYNESTQNGINGFERVIDWDDVEGATKYVVEINGQEDEVTVSQYVFDSRGEINFETLTTQTNAQTFLVRITAVGDGEEIVSSTAAEKSFAYLPVCHNLSLENGVLTWDRVVGATIYQVLINNQPIVTVDTNRYEAFEPNTQYEVRVKAGLSQQGTFSTWSAPLSFQFVEAPTLVWSRNGEAEGVTSGNISWEAVDNSRGYTVTTYYGHPRQDGVEPINSRQTDNTRVSLEDCVSGGLLPGTYYIYAATNAQTAGYSSSKFSEPIKIIVLEPISAVAFQSDLPDDYQREGNVTVVFNAPRYSDNVRIKVGGSDYVGEVQKDKSNGVTFRLSMPYTIESSIGGGENGDLLTIELQATKEGAGEYNETDQAVYINATQWKTVILSQLATPTNLTYTSGVLSWSPVDETNGYYYVIVNKAGAQIKSGITFGTTIAVPDDIGAGLYSFKVAARGNGNMIVSGNYSNELSFYKLPAPDNVRYDCTNNTLTWGLSSEIDPETSVQISNYIVRVGTVAHTVTNSSYVVQQEEISVSGTQIVVEAVGNKTANNIEVLTSDPSNKADVALIIYKLLTPKAPIVTNNVVSWTAIDNADSYTLTYKDVVVADNVKGNTVEINDELLSRLSDLSSGGAYGFQLVAHAAKTNNDVAYTDSDRSLETTITVLAHAHATLDNDTGIFSWNGSGVVTDYCAEVTYGTQKTETYILPNNEFNTFKPTIRNVTDGDTLRVELYALGDNGISSIRSVSQVFESGIQTHEAPTGGFTVTVDKFNITITLEDKANNHKGQIPYYGVNIGGTEQSVDQETMFAGYTYNAISSGKFDIKIRAVGGDWKDVDGQPVCFLASDYSESKTVYILPSVDASKISMQVEQGETEGKIVIEDGANVSGYAYTLKYCKTDEEDVNKVVVLAANDGSQKAGGTGRTEIEVDWTAQAEEATFLILEIVTKGNGTTTFDSVTKAIFTYNIN